jgi:DNA-binding CsgD family transcriptional regulator
LEVARGTRMLELGARFGQALVREFDEDVAGAMTLHDEVLEGWRTTEDRHDMVPTFLWQATFFARHGYEQQTTLRADALATMASGAENTESLAALAHALGEVALVSGEIQVAIQHFERARSQLQALNVPLELAITTWRLGDALAQAGDRDEAVERLSSAYRIVRGLGARAMAALVAASLQGLGESIEEGRHPDAEARVGRGGLTRRQIEIAQLLAAGLTNKEIAARLFLSPRTVDMHVSNILDRLDCRSRAEAVAKVAELGLLD